MTRDDLDRLAAVVAASEDMSTAPWRRTSYGVHDAIGEAVLIDDELHRADADAIVALRNAAGDLLTLAREALEARETYRLERCRADGSWEPLFGLWAGIRGIDAARMAEGRCAEWHAGDLRTKNIRIARERDGEVVR